MGAFAAFALLNYIRGIEDDVYEDRQPVEVLIADEDIPAGTPSVDALTMMAVKEIPLEIRPANFVDPNLTESIAGLIAVNDIPANQIIISGLFVDATIVQQSFKDQIPSGLVAISLNLDEVKAVGGNLQPGDEVNIMVLHENKACGSQDEEETGEEGSEEFPPPDVNPDELPIDEIYCTYTQPARYLFQRVEILKVGSRELLQPGQTTDEAAAVGGGGTITFMVPNDAAQIIASVAPDDIYLTLLPEDYEATELPPLTFEFFDGPSPAEDPEWLTPYGPDGFIEGDAGLEVNNSNSGEG
jgi:Flp pilus assembly protein CpaB